MSIKDALKEAIFDHTDETTTTPLSIRMPNNLNNQLEELSLTLDRSKSFLLLEFIKAGINETNAILEEKEKNSKIIESRDASDKVSNNKLVFKKAFMLNTNYKNDKKAHIEMLENHEAAAFRSGWKESICKLAEGDTVYLYQSGVGFVASGKVTGELIKSEYDGSPDEKYSKKLENFKTGFKPITAKEFKKLTNAGANFLATMSELNSKQRHILEQTISKRLKET